MSALILQAENHCPFCVRVRGTHGCAHALLVGVTRFFVAFWLRSELLQYSIPYQEVMKQIECW